MISHRTDPYLHQINVSDGGVPKRAVAHARISMNGIEGDRQRSPDIHGGPDRAVCLFSLEIIEALHAEGHSIAPGSAGENLTLAGLAWNQVIPGVRIRVGVVRLEVVSYTAPCRHNAQWFRGQDYSRISQKKHPGWSRVYARVVTEGVVHPGDAVHIEL